MNRTFTRFLLTTLALFFFAGRDTHAQEDSRYSIQLSTGNFIPPKAADSVFVSKSGEISGVVFRLLQFYEIPSEAERKEWAEQGLFLLDYVPNYCYYARIRSAFDWETIKGKLRAVLIPDERLKIEAPLYVKKQKGILGKEKLSLIVSYYTGLDYATIAADLKQRGARIEAHRDYSRQIDLEFPAQRLAELTALPYMQFLGEQEKEPINEATNYSHRNTTGRPNFLNTGQSGLSYTGNGVVIGIGESGTVNDEIDFKGRLTELESPPLSDHKIGTMQNAGGAGNLDPTNRNNAWGASFISFDAQSYTSLITTYSARYFNHSYGYGVQGYYNSSARDHDLRTVSYPNHIVSYSSGNNGTDTGYSPYNTFAGWGNITGAVKQNKNHLSVKNLGPDDAIYDWGCGGPAYDGRILPQLIIEGSEGTSYASPKAVGIFAILEEAYKTLNSGQQSNSSLLKGYILNTADDLGNAGPDFKTGYGRPNVRRAYQSILANQFFSGTVSNNGSATHTLSIPANTTQVRALLIWQDVAAAVNANPAIVNNLNLTATSPSSTSYLPWVLNHAANATTLNTLAVRGTDSLNTVEQITVDNPTAGTWTFTVNGAKVPSGPQSYYLVYELLRDTLVMAYPMAGEELITGDVYNLRWDSYGTTGTSSLDYRLNGGSWTNITSGLADSVRQYAWTAPAATGIQQIEFRVQCGTKSGLSGLNYIGKQVENLRVSKACSDTVTLNWSPVASATSYKVYRLGTKYMEEVTTNITYTSASAKLTGQSTTSAEYYSVSALSGTYEGQRTDALQKAVGDINCTEVSWTGTVSTDWFNTQNWASGSLPTATTNVRILASAPFQPVIAATGSLCKNITIASGASLGMSSSTAYTLSIWGDWNNGGTFTAGIGKVAFTDTLNYQEISGTSTTAFYTLGVAKKSQSNTLEVSSLITFSDPTNPLELTGGTFKLSSASTLTPFTDGTGAGLSGSTSVWNNGGTISYGNFSWFLNAGILRLSAGTINAGSASNNKITYLNNGTFTIEGGTLNVSGRIAPNSTISSGTYTQSGGTVNLNTVGSTSTTEPVLRVNANMAFYQSGGTIVLQRACSNTTGDYLNFATTYSVTGGTLQVGNASTPASQILRIYSTVPLYNLTVSSTNNPTARIETTDLTVSKDLTVNSGGTLNANGLNLNLQGNWTHNGAFTASTGEVRFKGSTAQTISGSATLSLGKVDFNNASGISLSTTVQASGLVKFTKGIVSATSTATPLTFTSAASVSGVSDISHVNGYVVRLGTGDFTYPVGSADKYQKIDVNPSVNATGMRVRYFAVDAGTGSFTNAGADPTTLAGYNSQEYWDVHPLSTATGVVRIYWDRYKDYYINGTGFRKIAHKSGGNWLNEGGTVTGTADSGNVLSSVVSSWSPFTLGSVSRPLAILLIDLWATNKGDANELNWLTGGEDLGDRFGIERSENGQDFSPVGSLAARGINGGTTYSFTDYTPPSGISYYRLHLLHMGEEATYSKTVTAIKKGADFLLNVSPNPFTDEVRLSITGAIAGKAIVFVNDASGKTVHTETLRSHTQQLSLSALRSGVYFLHYRDNARMVVVKLVK